MSMRVFKNIFKSVCFLILVLGLTSQVFAQVPPICSLQGSVVDASTSLPIPGASLTAINSLTITVTTTADVNGIYCFEGLPEGSYDVTASATGYLAQTVTDVVVVAGMTTVQDFSLTAPEEVDIKINPETLNTNNKGSGSVVTVKVYPPDGYSADDIIPESVIIADIGSNITNIEPIKWKIEDGNSVLKMKFNRQEILDVLRVSQLTADVEITITGLLNDDTAFIGSDSVTVKNKNKK